MRTSSPTIAGRKPICMSTANTDRSNRRVLRAPYLYPPVSHSPRIQEFIRRFPSLGHHPFPLPLGILLDEENGKALHYSACVRCSAFDGFPCLVNGKGDAQVICVDPALQALQRELLTGAYVERLETERVRTRGDQGYGRSQRRRRRSIPRISWWPPAER